MNDFDLTGESMWGWATVRNLFRSAAKKVNRKANNFVARTQSIGDHLNSWCGGSRVRGIGCNLAIVAITRGRGKKGGEPGRNEIPLRGRIAKQSAAELGYTKVKRVPFNSHNQPVFKKGTRYITPDVDGHRGYGLKMFDNRGRRIGTYDINLNRIGE